VLSHRLRVAAPVEGFVGFAIGRSTWEDTIAAHRRGELDDACTVTVISQETGATPTATAPATPRWQAASTDHGPDRIGTDRRAPARTVHPIQKATHPPGSRVVTSAASLPAMKQPISPCCLCRAARSGTEDLVGGRLLTSSHPGPLEAVD